MLFFDLDLVIKFILISKYNLLVQDDLLFKPMSNCKYCGLNNACIWREKRDDLMACYLDCQRRNKGFGELGSVESTNRGARKVLHAKLNQHLNVATDKPTPTCCVNGLSFLFPSTAHQDGAQLPDFLSEGERACKRQRQTDLLVTSVYPTGDTDAE